MEQFINERIENNTTQIQTLLCENRKLKEQKQRAEIVKGLERWKEYTFQSSSSLTPEFAQFAKDFKKHLKEILPQEADLMTFNRGHFYLSGFIHRAGLFVYFSTEDVRFNPGEWCNNILIRTAKHCKDYRGGVNQYTTIEAFKEKADKLLSVRA